MDASCLGHPSCRAAERALPCAAGCISPCVVLRGRRQLAAQPVAKLAALLDAVAHTAQRHDRSFRCDVLLVQRGLREFGGPRKSAKLAVFLSRTEVAVPIDVVEIEW